MTRSQATPASSQIIALEGMVQRLEQQVAAQQARIAELREALEHYAKQDIRNARHYPPEFAKDALASTDDLSALEASKAAAMRETLMGALAQWEAPWNGVPYIDWLRRKVGEVSDDQSKYVVCINCGRVVTWLEHEALRVAVDCPRCGAPKQFGPGIYVEDFHGYTMDEAIERQPRR